MRRHKMIMTGIAILVVGVAFAARNTAEKAGSIHHPASAVASWQPGSEIPMSAFESGEHIAHPPR